MTVIDSTVMLLIAPMKSFAFTIISYFPGSDHEFLTVITSPDVYGPIQSM